MQVHDGISALIAQQKGFKAVWASSFGCSTALGVPDDDALSATNIVECLRPIIRASRIPILVDGNSGFRSRAECRDFLRCLTELGAAGICFEDKCYPKRNTFYRPKHPLVAKNQYAELIGSACDQTPIMVVARTESLVVGESVDAVINRCELYCAAGAEAVFVSWIQEDVTTLENFLQRWNARKPILLNPTAYVRSLPKLLNLPGIAGIIWANHNIRACVKAMSLMCDTLVRVSCGDFEQTRDLDRKMSSMAEIFDLVGYDR